MIWVEKANKLPRRKRKERETILCESAKLYMLQENIRRMSETELIVVAKTLREMGVV